MKFYGAIIFTLLISSFAMAKEVDLETFNKKVIENIDSVIEDNPELYEKKSRGRSPASVRPEVDPTSKQLDKFEEQANGQKSW